MFMTHRNDMVVWVCLGMFVGLVSLMDGIWWDILCNTKMKVGNVCHTLRRHAVRCKSLK